MTLKVTQTSSLEKFATNAKTNTPLLQQAGKKMDINQRELNYSKTKTLSLKVLKQEGMEDIFTQR